VKTDDNVVCRVIFFTTRETRCSSSFIDVVEKFVGLTRLVRVDIDVDIDSVLHFATREEEEFKSSSSLKKARARTE
jgi:hypothetical protein